MYDAADAEGAAVRSGEDGHWSLHGVHSGAEVVRAEPFGEIDVELGLLWSDTAESAT
jgi:hypothetical protein